MGFIQVIEKICKQTAVYWANPVDDGYGGYSYDAPIEIYCRWEDKEEKIVEQKGTSSHGEEIISTSQIYVLQDMKKGEYLYLGDLDDLDSNPDNPKEVGSAFEIKKFEKSPTLKSTSVFLRKVYL